MGFLQTFQRYANAAIRAVNQLLGFLQIGLVSAAVGDLTSLTVGDLIIQFERIINNVAITARDSRTESRPGSVYQHSFESQI